MGSEWRDCIVTMIDLQGMKRRVREGRAVGSTLMRQFHRLVADEIADGFPSVAHAYTWNDSVLLLSYVSRGDTSFDAALRDADLLKRRIDQHARSYAIAVKGQAFPAVTGTGALRPAKRVTMIEASSYAMANCFEIEKRLGSLRKPWYVDGRIAKRISTVQAFQRKRARLLPSEAERTVYVFDGYLWSELDDLRGSNP